MLNEDTWPEFNLKPYCFGTEMLQEFLFCLAEKNKELVKNYNPLSVCEIEDCFFQFFHKFS